MSTDGVSNLSLAQFIVGTYPGITYSSHSVTRALNTTKDVYLGNRFVSVNSSGSLDLNTSAQVALQMPSCFSIVLYFYENYSTSSTEVFSNGQLCNPATTPACTSITCSDGLVTSSASRFSSYGGSSNIPEFPGIASALALLAAGIGRVCQTASFARFLYAERA